jgi:hypothetical protein
VNKLDEKVFAVSQLVNECNDFVDSLTGDRERLADSKDRVGDEKRSDGFVICPRRSISKSCSEVPDRSLIFEVLHALFNREHFEVPYFMNWLSLGGVE